MSDEEFEFKKEKRAIRLHWIFITICVALIAAVASSEYTMRVYSKKLTTKAEASADGEKNIDVIAKSLKSFREVIDKMYLGDIDENKLLDETLKGYVNGLGDEYSEYFTKDEWEEFETNTLGNYYGIGVYIGIDNNGNTAVIDTVESSPAEASGIQRGDVFYEVDGENVLGKDTEVISAKVKGEEGTKVKIKFQRNSEIVEYEVQRSFIKLYHVKTKMLEDKIGYMEFMSFDEGCADEFKTELEELQSQGVQKIIIDLRSNTGGIVDEALKIIDLFAPKDATMLVTVDADGNKVYEKSKNDPIISCPIVILTNEYSASASEILTGALKELVGAKTVGKTTYGKGVIQNVLLLNDKSALKLTTNEYYTPNETKINKVGISPDYEVEYNSEEEQDAQYNKAIEVIKTLNN